MVINSKKTENTAKVTYEVKVTRAHAFDKEQHQISFDIEVNGVSISNMRAVDYVNKEGKEGTMVNFPDRKGKDGNFYNYCFFPISKELRENILDQIAEILQEG